MKIYIWKDFVPSYACGVVLAVADTLDEAYAAIESEDSLADRVMLGPPDKIIDSEHPEKLAIVIWGID